MKFYLFSRGPNYSETESNTIVLCLLGLFRFCKPGPVNFSIKSVVQSSRNLAGNLNSKNIGLTIPGNWSFEIRWISHEIRRISPVKSGGFHPEIRRISPQWISPRFHVKSTQNLITAKTLQFDECRVGAMTKDFM